MATRIGVFFDGTGNNMWNDMAIGDGSQTNVAKLYQLYDKTNGFEAIYAEGVGTEAYTKNSDGSITKSGYQALSYYDTNNDGVVNSTDTRFNELSLWIDSNQDGVTDTGELKTLSEMGVTSLTLNSTTPYIQSGKGINTFYFRRGDGSDVIGDAGGLENLIV